MTDVVWKKGDTQIDERVMRFLAGEDIVLDRELFPYDIRATKAHVAGLASIGILEAGENQSLAAALDTLADAFHAGDFVLDERYEDGHSAIEHWLTEHLGDTGRKVHTGRSRNDQVLVAMRLYLLDRLTEITSQCLALAETCLQRAEDEGGMPMPGYTHLQRAVVSSTGMWFAGLAEAFIDDAELASFTRAWLDTNPLGTAAGYGVNLALDRDLTTQELGLARMQVNPIYAQNSRGKFELQAVASVAQAMLDIRRLAWDLSLFTSAEFDFVELPDRFTTGSSIMPNKRNPDVVELLRAGYAVVQGALAELQSILALPSGYHRDLQGTKGPTLRAMRFAREALELARELVAGVQFRPDRMAEKIEPAMYATDVAMELVQDGAPFRDAYQQALEDEKKLASRKPAESLAARKSPGAAGALCLDVLRARLAEVHDRDEV